VQEKNKIGRQNFFPSSGQIQGSW